MEYFLDHVFYFSIAFDKFKRILTLFAPSLLVFCYSQYYEMHATIYGKFLRALIAFKWSDLILDVRSG